MGESGNPAKRAQQKRARGGQHVRPVPRVPIDMIAVDSDLNRGLVLVALHGQITGMEAETAEQFAAELTEHARRVRAGAVDDRPHSRACGLTCPGHGPHCAKDCPTCHPVQP